MRTFAGLIRGSPRPPCLCSDDAISRKPQLGPCAPPRSLDLHLLFLASPEYASNSHRCIHAVDEAGEKWCGRLRRVHDERPSFCFRSSSLLSSSPSLLRCSSPTMSFLRPSLVRGLPRPTAPAIRSLHLGTPPIPPQRAEIGITGPQEFLQAIGRDAEQKVKVETWDGLFSLQKHQLKTAGVGVKDRRCACAMYYARVGC
jgi:hypothetical protein